MVLAGFCRVDSMEFLLPRFNVSWQLALQVQAREGSCQRQRSRLKLPRAGPGWSRRTCCSGPIHSSSSPYETRPGRLDPTPRSRLASANITNMFATNAFVSDLDSSSDPQVGFPHKIRGSKHERLPRAPARPRLWLSSRDRSLVLATALGGRPCQKSPISIADTSAVQRRQPLLRPRSVCSLLPGGWTP